MEQQACKEAEKPLLPEVEEAKKKAVEEVRKEEQVRKEAQEKAKRRAEEAEQMRREEAEQRRHETATVRCKAEEEEARREAEEKAQLGHFFAEITKKVETAVTMRDLEHIFNLAEEELSTQHSPSDEDSERMMHILTARHLKFLHIWQAPEEVKAYKRVLGEPSQEFQSFLEAQACFEQVIIFVKKLQTPYSIQDSRVLVDHAISALGAFRPLLTKCKHFGLLASITEHKLAELVHETILSVAEQLVQSAKGKLANGITPPHQLLEDCCDLLKLVRTISECVPPEASRNAAIGMKCAAMASELCDEVEATMLPIVMKLPRRTENEVDAMNGLRLKLQTVFTEGKHAQGDAHLQQCLELERNLGMLLAQAEKEDFSAMMCVDLSTANLGAFDGDLSRIAATLSTYSSKIVKCPVSDTVHTRLEKLQNDLQGAYERRAMFMSDAEAKLDIAVRNKHLPTLAKVYGKVMQAVAATRTSMQQVHVQARVPADMQDIGDRLKQEMIALLPNVLDDRRIDERGAQEAVEAYKRVFTNGRGRDTAALLWEARNKILERKTAAELAHERLDKASLETISTTSSASLQTTLYEAINCLQKLNEAVQGREVVRNTMKEERGIRADAAGRVLWLREQLAGENTTGCIIEPVC
jgi:hypothetical protein